VRAGLDRDVVIEYWVLPNDPQFSTEVFTKIGTEAALKLKKQIEDNVGLSTRDMELVIERELPILLTPFSHTYLDTPYKEASVLSDQNEMKTRVGLPAYKPQTIEEFYDWDPQASFPQKGEKAAPIAGVAAAVWSETVHSFDDMTFLALPRLPGMAQKAWSNVSKSPWPKHSAALPAHGRIWEKNGLDFFRSDLIK
jgi:hexosaminidase